MVSVPILPSLRCCSCCCYYYYCYRCHHQPPSLHCRYCSTHCFHFLDRFRWMFALVVKSLRPGLLRWLRPFAASYLKEHESLHRKGSLMFSAIGFTFVGGTVDVNGEVHHLGLGIKVGVDPLGDDRWQFRAILGVDALEVW